MKEINETWFELREDGLDYDTLKYFIEYKKELLFESMLKWYNSKIGEGKKDYYTNIEIIYNYLNKDLID